MYSDQDFGNKKLKTDKGKASGMYVLNFNCIDKKQYMAREKKTGYYLELVIYPVNGF